MPKGPMSYEHRLAIALTQMSHHRRLTPKVHKEIIEKLAKRMEQEAMIQSKEEIKAEPLSIKITETPSGTIIAVADQYKAIAFVLPPQFIYDR